MIKQKITALALAALGLTGFLFALSAGLVARYAPLDPADQRLLTEFYVIGLIGGVGFIAWGMHGLRPDQAEGAGRPTAAATQEGRGVKTKLVVPAGAVFIGKLSELVRLTKLN